MKIGYMNMDLVKSATSLPLSGERMVVTALED